MPVLRDRIHPLHLLIGAMIPQRTVMLRENSTSASCRLCEGLPALLLGAIAVKKLLQSWHNKIEEDTHALRHSRPSQKDGVYFLFVGLDYIGEHLYQATSGKIGPHMVIAHARKAYAGERHAPYGFAIVGEQRAVHHLIDDPPAFLERPDRRSAAEVETQAIVLGEIISLARCPATTEIFGYGLRRYGVTRLADHGAFEFQIMVLLAHNTPQEARRYVQVADRVKLAVDALAMLPGNNVQHLCPLDKTGA